MTDQLRETVRAHYAAAARQVLDHTADGAATCCGDGCGCGPNTGAPVRLRRATPRDLRPVTELLTRAGLPLDGVDGAFATGVVAESGDGAVVGAAAVEAYGRAALLRSVVVDEVVRGTGLGTELVCRAEGLACELGAAELYLLTETAAGFFPRLGYEAVPRNAAPGGIVTSREFSVACATTAVLMRRRIGASSSD